MKTLKNFSHFIQPVEKKKSEPCQIMVFCLFACFGFVYFLIQVKLRSQTHFRGGKKKVRNPEGKVYLL